MLSTRPASTTRLFTHRSSTLTLVVLGRTCAAAFAGPASDTRFTTMSSPTVVAGARCDDWSGSTCIVPDAAKSSRLARRLFTSSRHFPAGGRPKRTFSLRSPCSLVSSSTDFKKESDINMMGAETIGSHSACGMASCAIPNRPAAAAAFAKLMLTRPTSIEG
jgi:hypothetical protein